MSWCNQICQFTLQYSIIPIKCTNTTVLTLFCKHFFFYQSFTHFYQEIVTVWLQYINQFHFKFYTTSQNFIRSHLFSWTRPLYVCLKKVASWETTACIITSFVMWHEELLPQLLFLLPSLFTTAQCCASLSLCSISLNLFIIHKNGFLKKTTQHLLIPMLQFIHLVCVKLNIEIVCLWQICKSFCSPLKYQTWT